MAADHAARQKRLHEGTKGNQRILVEDDERRPLTVMSRRGMIIETEREANKTKKQ